MPLSVGSWMASQKLVRWIVPGVDDRKCESQRVRNVFDGVHQTSFPSVDFQDPLTFITWKQCFHSVPLLSSNPFSLCKSPFLYGVSAFEEISICVTFKCSCFNLGATFNICWYSKFTMDQLQILNPYQTCIVIHHVQSVLEVWWTSTGQG